MTYGASKGHQYSRSPYGKKLPNCYHRYPCSAYVNKKQNKTEVNFRCNIEYNGKIRDKEKGEDRRCSFRLSEEKLLARQKKEQEIAENMSIALELEGEEAVGNRLGVQVHAVASAAL